MYVSKEDVFLFREYMILYILRAMIYVLLYRSDIIYSNFVELPC